MDRGILEFVSLVSGLVIKHGGRIVHGCHPTFTSIILRQARLHAAARARKPVTLVMSELWARDLSDEEIESMTDVAEFLVVKQIGLKGPEDVQTRNQSLSAMRRVLVGAQNVMIAVGGKMHVADGKTPGVWEEMQLAQKRKIPRFLVGGLGGFAQTLASKLTPHELENELSHEANATLFGTSDIAACVNIIFDHLARSSQLARETSGPLRWIPDRRELIDTRSGTADREVTNLILRAVVDEQDWGRLAADSDSSEGFS